MVHMILISMEILRWYCKVGFLLLADDESNEIRSASIQSYECDSKVISVMKVTVSG